MTFTELLQSFGPAVEEAGERAWTQLPEFRHRGREFLFLIAALGNRVPQQWLISEADVHLTLLLSRWFRDALVLGVNNTEPHEDEQPSWNRLQQNQNVTTLMGDAMALLPALARGKAAVVVGGSEMADLRLAMQMLSTGRAYSVFLLDCHRQSTARNFVERFLPESFFSDDPRFSSEFRERTAEFGDESFTADHDTSHRVVGCIPHRSGRGYKGLQRRIAFGQWRDALT